VSQRGRDRTIAIEKKNPRTCSTFALTSPHALRQRPK